MAQAHPTRRARRPAQPPKEPTAPRDDPATKRVVAVLTAAFLLSGAAGLIHEVVWARLLSLVFGATSLAVATVLAAYMGGLALGSWWLGTRSERFADRRRAYAMLEVGIGVAAVLVPVLLALAAPAYAWLWRRFHPSFAVFSVLRLLVAGTILIGPTVLMGATLPLLADYCAGLKARRLPPEWLYTVNLAGAALGAAAAGFALMPALGVHGTIAVAALVNVGVGLAVLALPRLPDAQPAPRATPPVAPPLHPLVAAVAFASGLMAMVTQVAWTRVLALIVGSTTYAFSSVLVVYLVALGVGSTWAARRRTLDDVRGDLALAQGLFAVGLLAALYAVNRLPYWYLALNAMWSPRTLAGVIGLELTVLASVLFVPVLCAGTILPLTLIAAVPAGARGTGAAVGRVYAVNTIGAIVGALLAGFVLVPLLGTQVTLVCVCILAAALALWCAGASGSWGWKATTAAGAAVLVVIGAGFRPAWDYLALHAGVFEPERLGDRLVEPDERIIFEREGPTASVLVSRRHGNRSLIINARVNASDTPGDMLTQVMLAQVPMLLAPRTADMLIIGWGSGVTAGSALVWPETKVTGVEIEPAVVEASRLFHDVNHDALANPRLHLYEDDARHILLASEDQYDVIVSEPSHPWVSGVANLFTRDFYELAARRLRPDGVFAQWLQDYQISVENFRAIMAAYQAVFPEVLVFQTPDGGDLILLGSRTPLRPRLEDLERRWSVEATRVELARIELLRPEHLLATLYLDSAGVRTLTHGAPVNTDDDMYVEIHGPADMVWGKTEPTPRIVAALERLAVPIDGVLADPARLVGSRERLQALIDGLKGAERPTARYEKLQEAAS